MSEAFLKIVNMSVSASWLVLAVLLLRLVLKKAPKWVSVLLWGMVAVRLICPISIESALSLIPSAEPVPVQVITELQVVVQPGTTQTDTPVSDRTDTPVRDETGNQSAAAVTEPEEQGVPMVTVLAAGWAIGVTGMLVYTAVSYFLLRRRVATAIRLRDNIYRSEHVDSPFVLGILGPKIYLPFKMDSRDLAHVIAHEEAHIRRKDHWWKPLGFVLLAIHWFNPLLWVGYILLCRDIELACDEKVIKEMDNETKATYSEALVACSVNRRVIAACPLAFGEVGVKERVKTVMNYKKPAFWIVIAAVALCIVVAVCFLTNPKGDGPEVGNPKMLELPGVEWFVTPEELKEALNIKEGQILKESTDLAEETGAIEDRHVLIVTDLILYGREVPYAQFMFERDPGYDFAFQDAVVTFAEDTDMDALKADLAEIYGPGTSEPYSYYVVEGDRARDYNLKQHMEQNLEYLANTYKSEEGNPYMDALEDPAYMVHYWATENGCDLIPENVVEYFKYMTDQSWNADETLQDDEVLMEMLDQLPWVAMTLSNRNAAAIQRDALGSESEFASYYTNNYLELSAAWLADYLHLEVPYADPSLMEFPGLKWGMTPEEVKSALNLNKENLVFETINSDVAELMVRDITLFGYPLKGAIFWFMPSADGVYGLANIQAYFTEDTDMAKVRDAMIEVYGDGDVWSGADYYIIDDELTTSYGQKNPSILQHYWNSGSKIKDVVPRENWAAVTEYYETIYAGASQETISEWMEKVVIGRISLTDASKDGEYYTEDVPITTKNRVTFSGDLILRLLQKFGK